MCAISGSFSTYKLKDLYRLNAYRGELSYSLSAFLIESNKAKILRMFQDNTRLDMDLVDQLLPVDDDIYYVAHSQAPTTSTGFIHPAVYNEAMLWHNGIVKQKNLKENTWDTQWLLEQIIDYGWSALSRVDGTFACLMYNNGEFFIFRNEISPLFYDRYLNISSTKFEGGQSLEPNKVFKINFKYGTTLTQVATFETFENPYFIPEL